MEKERLLSMLEVFPYLTMDQYHTMFSGVLRKDRNNILRDLKAHKRIIISEEYITTDKNNLNIRDRRAKKVLSVFELLAARAVDVLADKPPFYIFFTVQSKDGRQDGYDLLLCEDGEETIFNRILEAKSSSAKTTPKRIVIIDNIRQAAFLQVPNLFAYYVANENGSVSGPYKPSKTEEKA